MTTDIIMGTFYDSGIDIDKLFPDDSIIDHVKDATGMWAGSRSPLESPEYVIVDPVAPKITVAVLNYPPALYKCFDEAVVNALDNLIRIGRTNDDNETTEVRIHLGNDGRITVSNNGRGVPVGFHAEQKIWSVQRIFGIMFKGRAKTDKESKVTGDANRVGIKIANILSSEFTVSTIYTKDKKTAPVSYKQFWSANMTNVLPPTIEELPKGTPQQTTVSFMPSYAELFGTTWSPKQFEALNSLFRFRAYTAAAYAGFYTGGRCKVYYNDEYVKVASITDLARLLAPNAAIHTAVLTPPGNLSWEIAILIAENDSSNKHSMQITNVNGVNVKRGKHIDSTMELLIEGVKERVTSGIKGSVKFQPSYVYTNCSILINAQVPGAEWSGQRKDELIASTAKITPYALPAKLIDLVAADMKDKILLMIYGKSPVTGIVTKSIKPEKYTPAKNAGTKHSALCTLLLPEGDSAGSMIAGQISQPGPDGKPMLGWDNYGFLTLGGVIMNARREVNMFEIGNKRCIDINKKLANNQIFNELIAVLGLVPGETYITDKERATLKYGRVVVCTDQDHDGIGFIYPLVVNLFSIFWPHLVKTGFVSRWDTPRRRAIPKKGGKIIEFTTENQYAVWLANNNVGLYNIDYIKGLASHEPRDQKHMFERFNQDVVITYLDPDGEKNLEIMFGKETPARKDWLSKVMPPDPDEITIIHQRKETVSQLINYQGREHAKRNIIQKIWSVVDGMNESGRKVLSGALKALSKDDKMKVAILAGSIVASEHYQHGEASLQETIVGKALICVGGMQLPQLIPRAMLGSRRNGGGIKEGDSGAARYVYVSLNHRLLSLVYPEADYPSYEFNYEDGFRVEPRYFVPTIPMAILETIEMPAHGWKIKTWSRDVFAVIQRVIFLINNYVSDEQTLQTSLPAIPPNNHGFFGEYRKFRNKEYCFGKYWYDESRRVVVVTELPLGTWTQKYSMSLMGESTRQYYKGRLMWTEVVNYSSEENVRIEIYLAPVDKVTGFDPVKIIEQYADYGFADGFEIYLDLSTYTTPCLTFLDTDEKVLEMASYEETLKRWFVIRRRFYTMRIEREITLLEAEIKLYENIKRYISVYEQIIPPKTSEENAIVILSENGFDRCIPARTKGMIGKEYIPAGQIMTAAFNNADTSYDYLFSTTDRDRMAGSIRARDKHLDELKAKLVETKTLPPTDKFLGASVWKQELYNIIEVVKQGRACNWDFNKGKFSY